MLGKYGIVKCGDRIAALFVVAFQSVNLRGWARISGEEAMKKQAIAGGRVYCGYDELRCAHVSCR